MGRNRFALGSIATIVQSLRREGTAAQLLLERVRKAAADATLAELAVIKAKGEVAPIAEFERALHMRNAIIQTNVMHVPARAVLQLLGETDERRFREVLTAELRTALKQAADTEITEADFDEDFRDNDECDESDEGPEGGN